MYWKKQRKQSSTNTQQDQDHLSLIKAAAWAWYQHGSGSDSTRPTICESELTRTGLPTTPRPTRYKLEALSGPARGNSSSSSLLDFYEIERITKELNTLIGSTGKKGSRSKRVDTKKVSGFWACGSREDVVETAVLSGRSRIA